MTLDDDQFPKSRSSLRKILSKNLTNEKEWLDQIKNNIENILNTRSQLSFEEYLEKSHNLTVLDFGVPDFMNTPNGGNFKDNLCQIVEVALLNFEPRITNVSIELVTSQDKKLRFHIKATVKNSSININLVLNNLLWKID